MTETTMNRSSSPSRLVGAMKSLLSQPPAYLGILLLLGFAAITRPNLMSPLLLMLILRQAAPLGLVTIGQSLVVRCRSVDFSSGGIMVAVSYLLTSGVVDAPLPVMLLLAVVLGCLVGLANGLIITRIRASAVIVTIAMGTILTGIVIALSQIRAQGDVPPMLAELGRLRVGMMPVVTFVWLALLIPGIFLRYTVFGRVMDASGANPEAAEISGLPFLRVVLIAHVVSGLTAALAACVLLSFVGVGSLSIGDEIALNALAATILGGVNFGSGKGGMLGPAVAAFMLMFLFNLLTSFGLGEAGRLTLQGAIVGGAALVYSMRNGQSAHS